MNYLTAAQILLIHSMIVDETGGLHGVRDRHALESLVESEAQVVFGRELYPGVFHKAALYGYRIIMGHVFSDGNKRTGMTSAAICLENNGYQFYSEKGEIEQFALRVIEQKLEIQAIADWFEKHARKNKKK